MDSSFLPHRDVARKRDHRVGQGNLAATARLVILVVVIVGCVAVANALREVLKLFAIAARRVGRRQACFRAAAAVGPAVLGLVSSDGFLPCVSSGTLVLLEKGLAPGLLEWQDLFLLAHEHRSLGTHHLLGIAVERFGGNGRSDHSDPRRISSHLVFTRI